MASLNGATTTTRTMTSDENDIQESEDSSKSENDVIPGYSDINTFSQESLQACLQAIKSSNNLPTGQEYDYYSSYAAVLNVMEQQGKRLLSLVNGLLRQQNLKVGQAKNLSILDLEEKFDVLVDANDVILERVSNLLDEAEGLKQKEQELIIATLTPKPTINTSWNKKNTLPSKISSPTSYKLLGAKNILRPQLKFKDKIDNSSRPFLPSIKVKPNALKELSKNLLKAQANYSVLYNDIGHPYQFELDRFQPLAEQLISVEPQLPKPLLETPLKCIDSLNDLQSLCELLKNEKEFAVDLENHSYRSFQGLTCLMQISTRNKDFIIDTLELRSEMNILNEVFTNPKIIKIFHGADMDIEWLQRDFSMYVVNMFDTGQAARTLQFPRYSLAYLLKHYCKLEIDKQYQLADWRIRPLPAELINYSREDTHYLLYIYDCMKNELIEKGNEQNNLLLNVLRKSKSLCEKQYEKVPFCEDDYQEIYKKSRKFFNSSQLTALHNLYIWRNKIARLEDESLGFVLPNHMMLQIAETMPREKQGILACCTPIPPFVRQHLTELHEIVFRAKEIPIPKIHTHDALIVSIEPKALKYDPENVLDCPHDLSHSHDKTYSDICLLNLDNTSLSGSIFECDVRWKKPDLSIFESHSSEEICNKPLNAEIHNILKTFLSPFQRYCLVKPRIGQIEELKTQEPQSEEPIQKIFAHWASLSKAAMQKQNPPLPSENPSAVSQEPEFSELPDVKADEKELVPLNRLIKPIKKKKRNKRKLDDEFFEAGPFTKEPVNKKKVESAKTEIEEPFQPFDYSKAGLSVFDTTPGNKKSLEEEPFTLVTKKKNRKAKFKKKNQDELKSMIFGKNKSSGEIQWPKR